MLDKTDREEITKIVKEVIETDVTPQFVSLKNEMSDTMKEMSEMMDIKFAKHTKEIIQEISELIKSKYMPMFTLLLEGQQAIIDKIKS